MKIENVDRSIVTAFLALSAIKVKFSDSAKVSDFHSLYITEKIHWLFGDTVTAKGIISALLKREVESQYQRSRRPKVVGLGV